MTARELPPDYLHLVTTGHLMAWEREALGFLPQMMCSQCQKRPVDLIWRHEPLAMREKQPAVIPGTVWGKDVTVICPCCSFAMCSH